MEKVLILSNDQLFNNQVRRIINYYSLEFESLEMNVNVINRFLKQVNPDVLIIHFSIKCMNLGVLLDYLVTNKIIPVIYINNVSNYGLIYNVMNDVYFMNIDEMKLNTLLEFGIQFMIKMSKELNQLNRKLEKLEHKIEEDRLVTKAKHKLMNDLNLSEEDAYKYILRQSMDHRKSKGKISQEILES